MIRAKRTRRRWRIAALVPLVLAAAWGVGFMWFLRLTAQVGGDLGKADGIVVLTGGAERIEAGLRLLADDRAGKLLISGIGGGADLAVLARGSGVDTAALAGRIKLGRLATSTHGNARETAGWAHDNGIGTLIVVTAWYHMPRALTELRTTMPAVTMLAAPVRPQAAQAHPEPSLAGTNRLLIEEYNKYLLARVGLTGWLPDREAPQTGGHTP